MDTVKKITALKELAKEAAKVHQANLNKKDVKMTETAASLAVLDEKIKACNAQITADTQEVCLAEGKAALLHAVKLGFQDRVVKKVTQDKDSKAFTVEVKVEEKGQMIDLVALNKKGEGLSKDGRWVTYIPALRKFVGVAVGRALKDANADVEGYALLKNELGLDRADMIGHVESIMEVADLPADSDPFSVGALQKIVQVMADMMLGDNAPLIRRKDVRFIITLCARESKELKYKVANDKGVFKLFQKAMYAAIHGLGYDEEIK